MFVEGGLESLDVYTVPPVHFLHSWLRNLRQLDPLPYHNRDLERWVGHESRVSPEDDARDLEACDPHAKPLQPVESIEAQLIPEAIDRVEGVAVLGGEDLFYRRKCENAAVRTSQLTWSAYLTKPFRSLMNTRCSPLLNRAASSNPPGRMARLAPSRMRRVIVPLLAPSQANHVSMSDMTGRRKRMSAVSHVTSAFLITSMHHATVHPTHNIPCGWKANSLLAPGFISSSAPSPSNTTRCVLREPRRGGSEDGGS
mmetsp:Transcript_67145/g.212566  ORF Transcript_67145/g.212566 Transcript_67145/m.212566 type:complete len:255 (-) Transcript_67145:1960-2724(-)